MVLALVKVWLAVRLVPSAFLNCRVPAAAVPVKLMPLAANCAPTEPAPVLVRAVSSCAAVRPELAPTLATVTLPTVRLYASPAPVVTSLNVSAPLFEACAAAVMPVVPVARLICAASALALFVAALVLIGVPSSVSEPAAMPLAAMPALSADPTRPPLTVPN